MILTIIRSIGHTRSPITWIERSATAFEGSLLQFLESVFILFSNFSFTKFYISREIISGATIMHLSLYTAQIIEVLLAFDTHFTLVGLLARFLKILRNYLLY
ncbi:uncharacterized protein VTP21DRAFT_11289 [Calcarisporiella thermophila]|uniref:uncharacterized protein n=1 Tax=Calcarisporiella thermophila TaxID=911321 RepID=UPI0037447F97